MYPNDLYNAKFIDKLTHEAGEKHSKAEYGSILAATAHDILKPTMEAAGIDRYSVGFNTMRQELTIKIKI